LGIWVKLIGPPAGHVARESQAEKLDWNLGGELVDLSALVVMCVGGDSSLLEAGEVDVLAAKPP
jgi:hypothetical protein